MSNATMTLFIQCIKQLIKNIYVSYMFFFQIRYFHNAQKFYNTNANISVIFCNKCIKILKWYEDVYKTLKTLDYCLSGDTELLPANNSTPTLFSTI